MHSAGPCCSGIKGCPACVISRPANGRACSCGCVIDGANDILRFMMPLCAQHQLSGSGTAGGCSQSACCDAYEFLCVMSLYLVRVLSCTRSLESTRRGVEAPVRVRRAHVSAVEQQCMLLASGQQLSCKQQSCRWRLATYSGSSPLRIQHRRTHLVLGVSRTLSHEPKFDVGRQANCPSAETPTTVMSGRS